MVRGFNTYGVANFYFTNHILSQHSKFLTKTEKGGATVKKFISYLIVFLLGWSCAVWSYSDAIYTKVEKSTEKTISQENSSEESK